MARGGTPGEDVASCRGQKAAVRGLSCGSVRGALGSLWLGTQVWGSSGERRGP